MADSRYGTGRLVRRRRQRSSGAVQQASFWSDKKGYLQKGSSTYSISIQTLYCVIPWLYTSKTLEANPLCHARNPMFGVCLAAKLVPVSKSLLLPPFSSTQHEAVDRMAADSSPLVYPQVLYISSVKYGVDFFPLTNSAYGQFPLSVQHKTP